MDILIPILVVLHLLSWALVLGYSVGYLRKREVPKGLMHAAGSALLTGILIVGALEMGTDRDLNHLKIGIKLAVAAVITVLAYLAEKKQDGHKWLAPIAGLTVLNVALAVIW